jgi:hypothetical protein
VPRILCRRVTLINSQVALPYYAAWYSMSMVSTITDTYSRSVSEDTNMTDKNSNMGCSSTLTLTYGLFRDGSPAPAAFFYTQFAASKQCRELNLRTPGGLWSVRVLKQ